jgi:peptidoglycan/xylan/chitin deacetylase (PgdA/CDA1 family)
MYHAFGDGVRGQPYAISTRSFTRQMRVLAVLGYRVIPLEDLLEALLERHTLPRRAVVITIDDGYRDNFEIAMPLLRDLRYPATIFLVSRRLGEHNDWSQGDELAGRKLLSVEDVQRMRDGGIHFGAHTRTHPRLPEAPDDVVRGEVAGSRADLERELGWDVPVFTYPYGQYDDRAVAEARRAYLGACTTEPRRVYFNDDPFLVPRIEVLGTDSLLRFLRKLSFGGG